MTKKHFKAIAQLINELREVSEVEGFVETSQLVYGLARICKEVNPRFDRSLFEEACLGDVSWLE
jgi:hypothetical protein